MPRFTGRPPAIVATAIKDPCRVTLDLIPDGAAQAADGGEHFSVTAALIFPWSFTKC